MGIIVLCDMAFMFNVLSKWFHGMNQICIYSTGHGTSCFLRKLDILVGMIDFACSVEYWPLWFDDNAEFYAWFHLIYNLCYSNSIVHCHPLISPEICKLSKLSCVHKCLSAVVSIHQLSRGCLVQITIYSLWIYQCSPFKVLVDFAMDNFEQDICAFFGTRSSQFALGNAANIYALHVHIQYVWLYLNRSISQRVILYSWKMPI